MTEQPILPHKLTLNERKQLTVTGVTEVVSFDESGAELKCVDGRLFIDGEEIRIVCLLSADPSAFLNPEYVIKSLRESVGVLSDPCLVNESYSIMREEAYTADMKHFR